MTPNDSPDFTFHRYYPDDIVFLSLKDILKEKRYQEFDEKWIHVAIFNVKKLHREFLKEFTFNTTGTFPFSALIGRILMRAKINGMIGTLNPTLIESGFNEGVSEFIETDLMSEFNTDEKIIIEEISNSIKTQMIECS